jgi:hypothetical protein
MHTPCRVVANTRPGFSLPPNGAGWIAVPRQAWATTPAGLDIRSVPGRGPRTGEVGSSPSNAGRLTSHQDGEVVCPNPDSWRATFFERESGMGGLAGFDENAAIRFQDQSVTLSICIGRKIRMNSHVAKLATASSFGIALLGLYFIFTSTNTHLSLSACAMYIVGTAVGVLLSAVR